MGLPRTVPQAWLELPTAEGASIGHTVPEGLSSASLADRLGQKKQWKLRPEVRILRIPGAFHQGLHLTSLCVKGHARSLGLIVFA